MQHVTKLISKFNYFLIFKENLQINEQLSKAKTTLKNFSLLYHPLLGMSPSNQDDHIVHTLSSPVHSSEENPKCVRRTKKRELDDSASKGAYHTGPS